MKRCLLLVTMLLWATAALAVGTVTQTYKYDSSHGDRVATITFAWTADADAATVPATATTRDIGGYVFLGITNPGAVAPTDNYDITLTDADGIDVFGGELTNRDQTNSEQAVPKIGTTVYGSRYVDGALTLTITGNSVNSATGTVKIYVYEE